MGRDKKIASHQSQPHGASPRTSSRAHTGTAHPTPPKSEPHPTPRPSEVIWENPAPREPSAMQRPTTLDPNPAQSTRPTKVKESRQHSGFPDPLRPRLLPSGSINKTPAIYYTHITLRSHLIQQCTQASRSHAYDIRIQATIAGAPRITHHRTP